MRILIATDAWHPQVNGVVRTLNMVAENLRAMGEEVIFLTPADFRTISLPTYPDIPLSLATPRHIARYIAQTAPDAIHIATEGPIGFLVRRHCLRHDIPFTTSFHTRFAEYVSARAPIPESCVWSVLKRFHGPSGAVMAATPGLADELRERGFGNVVLWPRGVDAELFRPRPEADLGLAKPVFLSVGRVAIEKNLDAFLSLDLPGTKVVIGEGPEKARLEKQYPDAVFLGHRTNGVLASAYAAADVFVFPSKTDTFGLVLLEALASGTPVAAFPVAGPRDVIGTAPIGALNDDLRQACLDALDCSRDDCRSFIDGMSWKAVAQIFLRNVSAVRAAGLAATGKEPVVAA